jgi:hypothetical protein
MNPVAFFFGAIFSTFSFFFFYEIFVRSSGLDGMKVLQGFRVQRWIREP